MDLAQMGYPDPKDFKTREELIMHYTQKVGETDAVRRIIQFLESQEETRNHILSQESTKKQWEVGSDPELDEQRRRLQQAMDS